MVRAISTTEGLTEYAPIGHTTNLAAWMQAVAPVGSIAVSGAIRRFYEGYPSFKALGATRVKGISEPVEVTEVTGLGPLGTPLKRAVGRGLTKFVGRQIETAALKRALERAKTGRGQIVVTVTEAGVDKSRGLFNALRSELALASPRDFEIPHWSRTLRGAIAVVRAAINSSPRNGNRPFNYPQLLR